MKISANRIEIIKSLLNDVAELDNLIKLHRKFNDEEYIIYQYEAKKYNRFQLLVKHLMHPSLNNNEFTTFPFLQKITHRYYPHSIIQTNNEVLKTLEDAIL